ncbi:glucoamylase family protein [Acidovorax sp. A1169]|uniref:glucoamylase family protein n=1 Tax=Acidovorax sp. A1169 TaxID=3059524 RepID=UPI002737BAB3|nr:glucoamylase family protein [Acidovorax sp. A1169]MDP4078950.1 glucoamylase family protein [Acidovorax sp. A1169]
MLDTLQRQAFDYFPTYTHPRTGLVADTSRPGAPASIAVVGFALSAYPVGVERGWIGRDEAVGHCLDVLRFFAGSDQSGAVDATGWRGFYFHFLNSETGLRAWASELSSIDTALLIMGMLTAAAYFDAATPAETELRKLANTLYERVNWNWSEHDDDAVALGWKPECGFLNYGWQGYSEAIVLYALGLGAASHRLTAASFEAWTVTYQWENIYGIDFLYAGPLFMHQFSHAWIDFRGIRDRFMHEKDCDYFENSRRAVQVQRQYAIRNPRGFSGYGQDCWGLSAGDGPSVEPKVVAGRRQAFYGYAARGVPWGPDDGTLNGACMVASLVFAPEIALPALRKLVAEASPGARAVHASGVNATAGGEMAWISEGEFGLDQGLMVLMIENFRSGLLWRLTRSIPCLRAGLLRAGFTGGWL